jgi:arabinogalactan endo-1,4-beta-galactosidase
LPLLTPKYPVSLSVSKYRLQKRLVSVSVSVFLTLKIVVSVSVFLTLKIVVSVLEWLGVSFSDTDTDTKTVFCVLKENNANKVGFRIKKYLRTPQNLGVGVGVRFSDTKNSGVGVGKTDIKKCWCRVSEKLTTSSFDTDTDTRVLRCRD